MRKLKKFLFLCLAFSFVVFIFEIKDKTLNVVNKYSKGLTQEVKLGQYKARIQNKKITQINDNLSGISYNIDTQTLFAITNRPREIHEISKEGELLRTIQLEGFSDTEGITYIGKSSFAIVDERLHGLFIVNINKNTQIIKKEEAINSFLLKKRTFKNFGFEGIAYNSIKDVFYLVQERFPTSISTINNLSKSVHLSVQDNNPRYDIPYYIADLSGAHYNLNTQNLLLLSDESKLLTAMSLEGKLLNSVKLEKGALGLMEDIPQAEGVTMDEKGDLYIVSEPNLFYRFSKPI